MPTVLRLDGFRVVIYSNDHRPEHVHMIGSGGEAVFILNCPHGPPTLRESYGLRLAILNTLQNRLESHITKLCSDWELYHGHH